VYKKTQIQIPGLEFLYEGAGIMSLRIKFHFGGHSHWIGIKSSLAVFTSSLGVYICVYIYIYVCVHKYIYMHVHIYK
jgi:hypothetical protein